LATLWRDPEAIPVLLELLADKDAGVRGFSLQSFDGMAKVPATVTEAVKSSLKDESPGNRGWAANTLSRICSDEATVLPAILPLLKDENVLVRRRIVGVLRSLGPKAKEAVPVLRERLSDRQEDSFVRFYAAEALDSIGPQAKSTIPVLARLNVPGVSGPRRASRLGRRGEGKTRALPRPT
jgi:HEAT repeat protein